MKCSQCGKEFTVLYPDLWAYKTSKKWFCTWKCLRADEKKGEEEMPRMKKDGTPAKKPGPRKQKSVLEKMPIHPERDQMMMENLKRMDEEEERQRQEMKGKTIHFQQDDKPLTAEERLEKKKLLPTRIATRTGTWEIVSEYKGDETLVGFRTDKQYKFGPLDATATGIVMTVEEWRNLYDELEPAFMLMVL